MGNLTRPGAKQAPKKKAKTIKKTPKSDDKTLESNKVQKNNKSLSFEQIITLIIQKGKDSSLRDYHAVSQAFSKDDGNARFQAKRIKDTIRLLMDSNIIFKKGK